MRRQHREPVAEERKAACPRNCALTGWGGRAGRGGRCLGFLRQTEPHRRPMFWGEMGSVRPDVGRTQLTIQAPLESEGPSLARFDQTWGFHQAWARFDPVWARLDQSLRLPRSNFGARFGLKQDQFWVKFANSRAGCGRYHSRFMPNLALLLRVWARSEKKWPRPLGDTGPPSTERSASIIGSSVVRRRSSVVVGRRRRSNSDRSSGPGAACRQLWGAQLGPLGGDFQEARRGNSQATALSLPTGRPPRGRRHHTNSAGCSAAQSSLSSGAGGRTHVDTHIAIPAKIGQSAEISPNLGPSSAQIRSFRAKSDRGWSEWHKFGRILAEICRIGRMRIEVDRDRPRFGVFGSGVGRVLATSTGSGPILKQRSRPAAAEVASLGSGRRAHNRADAPRHATGPDRCRKSPAGRPRGWRRRCA